MFSASALDHFLKKIEDYNNLPNRQEIIESRRFLEEQGLIENLDSSYTSTNKGKKVLRSAQKNNSSNDLDIDCLSTIIELLTNQPKE